MRGSTIAAAFLLLAHGCASDPPQQPDGSPQGRLGHLLGTFLKIEGVRAEKGKVGDQHLIVDRVNETELPNPEVIWIEDLDLPPSVRCEISGYETGRWIGLPPDVGTAEGLPPHQAEWQFYRYFVPTSVQAPQELAETFDRDHPRPASH